MTTNQFGNTAWWNQQWVWWGFTPPPPPPWWFTPPPPPPPPWWGFTPPPPPYNGMPYWNVPNQWYAPAPWAAPYQQAPAWAAYWNPYQAPWANYNPAYWAPAWWMPWAGTPPPPMWTWTPPKDEGPVVPIWSFGRDASFRSNIKLPPHTTKVDDQLFLRLLAWSISLTIDEKKKIIENFWSLSQYQVDELIKIFEEEKSKFSALDVKHRDQLRALERQHAIAWDAFEAEGQQKAQSQVEDVQAEQIRKSLGLN